MKIIGNTALALGLAGAVMTAAPSIAAPVLSSTTALKQAGAGGVEQVQWRGRHGGHHHWGGGHRWGGGRALAGAGIGFAAGALVGSAIASSNYGYYGGPYYGGYYDAPVAYGGPVYAAPAPVYRAAPGGRCWITTGGEGQYGYWAAC